MKALQKLSKWLSDYTSIVVIAIAVVTFIVPGMMDGMGKPSVIYRSGFQ